MLRAIEIKLPHFGEMQSSFLDNARRLCDIFGRGDDAISSFRLHGSYFNVLWEFSLLLNSTVKCLAIDTQLRLSKEDGRSTL